MNLFLFGLSKTETGAKTAPRVPKLGYFDRLVPKHSDTHNVGALRGLSCSPQLSGITLNQPSSLIDALDGGGGGWGRPGACLPNAFDLAALITSLESSGTTPCNTGLLDNLNKAHSSPLAG